MCVSVFETWNRTGGCGGDSPRITNCMEEPGASGEGSMNSVWWNLACKWDKMRNEIREVRGADTEGRD